MRIIFSEHAKIKLGKLKIERIWVEETIKWPDVVEQEDKKYYAIRKLNGVRLKVVYVKEKYIKVVTFFTIT